MDPGSPRERTADAPGSTAEAEAQPSTWDLVVIDMPPTPETLAVLALPGQLRRYLRRLLPTERQAARALRPMLAQLAGVPMPTEWLYDTAARCERELAVAQAVIESPATSVRIVIEPGPAGAEALRTARAGLALYGLRADAVVANRLLPTGSADPWLAALSGQQQTALKALYTDVVTGTTLCELPHLGRDPDGPDDLAELVGAAVSATFGGGHGTAGPVEHIGPVDQAGPVEHTGPVEHGGAVERPGLVEGAGLADGLEQPVGLFPDTRTDGSGSAHGARPAGPGPRHDSWPVEDRLDDEGVLIWRLPLPGAERGELDLIRRGDELVLTVGPFCRIVPLPSALRRCSVSGAGLADGELKIRFTPDATQWPRTSPAPG
ncbi:ArsA-related P-loop ATPase [Streptomyces sp. NPDC004647]|uniref:ArsA family ATPase n=1 Tax=Streptomyces sp. NPDC004647 TaxID=3154671 RepID=UPI0033AC066F